MSQVMGRQMTVAENPFRRIASNVLAGIVNHSLVQCVVLLHLLCWSAESGVHATLALLVLGTIVCFRGCDNVIMLVYHTARYFSVLVYVFQGILKVIFIFFLYEMVLGIIGYHSEDYKKFKYNLQLFFTTFTADKCAVVLGMTSGNDTVVLVTGDVVGLCNLTWNVWYLAMIGIGLYMGMVDYVKIRKHFSWQNVYLSAMMLVVWYAIERFLWFGLQNFEETERTACLFVHYMRNGEEGFKAASFIEDRSENRRKNFGRKMT